MDHPNHIGWGAAAVSLRQDMIRPFIGILRVLMVGAALFLLIACSNVAAIVAARRARDHGERGLRLALGASRWRLMRHEIAEMLWLALGGSVVAGANMRFGYRAGDWEEEQYWGQYHTVSPRYFEVLGIPISSGRVFNDRDRGDGPPVVIISETLARGHFDGDAVGREIVGVVGSVRHFGPDQAPPAEMYVPLAQDPWLLGHILVRPGGNLSPDAAREVAAVVDPEVPVQALFPFDQFVSTWFAPLRFQLTIVALLAAAVDPVVALRAS